MLYNYIKIAIRNLLRHKVFSFINIFGLALGMTCSILLLLWVKDEISINKFHAKDQQLYQVLTNAFWGELSTFTTTPGPLADVIAKEIPEIARVAKIAYSEGGLFKAGKVVAKETNGRYVTPEFFEVFFFPLLYGNAKTALADPNAIIISQTLARKYFNRENAVGEVINIRDKGDVKVTGVMQDMPRNSTIQFDFAAPLKYYEQDKSWLTTWGNFNLITIVELYPNVNPKVVNDKIKDLLKKNNPTGTEDELFLQKFSDTYLHANYINGKPNGGRIEYVRLFSGIALFILIIACINFMNLATARSAQRAKEVGVRKVIGATKKLLVGQFMGEAILLTLVAMVLSMILVSWLMPVFNELTGKLIIIKLSDPFFLVVFLGTALITGVLAGSYPALFLSSLKPVVVLKGTLKFKPNAILVRQGLVVFQFMLSIVLIIGMIITYRQMDYIKNKNLGIDRENVVMVNLDGDLSKKAALFLNDLQQLPGVNSVATAGGNPMGVQGSSGDISWPGRPKEGASIAPLHVGYGFTKTMNIELKAGRDFSEEFGADTSNYIINEAAARMMGMREPLNQEISFWNGKGRIIGVMKDYHLQSLREAIAPLILVLNPNNASTALIKVENKNLSQTLAQIKQLTKKYNPDYPFEYRFMDEDFANQYKSETMVGKLTNYFASIAILISCLGLFGLAIFTAQQRTKEIGIRKVLGASVAGIVAMLSKDFLKLVLISNVIAWPFGWYFMYSWLQNFAYRIEINPWIFGLAALTTITIALITVSFQAVRAAIANPVRSLRSE